jgi:nicotinamide-nucleotide amidase
MTDLGSVLPTARELVTVATRQKLRIATAESCTGGLIAAALTEVPGSSAVVDRGFVTYSNQAKMELLGVDSELIRKLGAVSREVALAMAEGAMARSDASLVVAVTGVAGPTGGTAEKPIGLVHLAALRRGGSPQHTERRYGNIGRSAIRLATVRDALAMLAALI